MSDVSPSLVAVAVLVAILGLWLRARDPPAWFSGRSFPWLIVVLIVAVGAFVLLRASRRPS